VSRNKQGAWTGGSTRHFSPRKPHRKGSKKRSSAISPAQDPGPGPYVPNHLAEHYARHTHVSSVSPLVLMVALHQQLKRGDSC
jgi:hypothetical protein